MQVKECFFSIPQFRRLFIHWVLEILHSAVFFEDPVLAVATKSRMAICLSELNKRHLKSSSEKQRTWKALSK